MKCEIDVWKNTFKNSLYGGFRWKHLVSIPFFYILRIFMINNLHQYFKTKNLPNEI